MTRRRWIADEFSDRSAALTGSHAEHLVRVLRARVGQEFDLAVGTAVRRGRILTIAESRVDFELGDEIPALSAPPVTIILSIFKFDRMEWAIEKCTELGVARIMPVIARRTETHLASAALKRVERWQRIARQASEQSRRASLPEIFTPMRLKDAILAHDDATRIVLSEYEREAALREVLDPHPSGQAIAMAFGPEGGWAEDELDQFLQAGWIMASLGKTILRAETAAIAATAIALAELY
jgi:16S rRNA (uracil1498-N3)-methyltransferase